MPESSSTVPPAVTTQEHIRSEQVLEAQSTGLNIFLHITLVLISLTGIGLIVSIPVWIIAAIVKDKSQKSDVPLAAERALTRFIGDKPKYMATGMAHLPSDKVTGAGIAYHDGRVFVLEAGVAAEIPWKRIRNYQWSVDGYDKYTNLGLNPGASIHSAALTEKARQEAHQKSGFFITTSDIDHPRWHFQTMDVGVCEKWQEILNQMSEGTLPRR